MCGIFCSLRAGCRGDIDDVHGGTARPSDPFRDLSDRLKVANAARGVSDIINVLI